MRRIPYITLLLVTLLSACVSDTALTNTAQANSRIVLLEEGRHLRPQREQGKLRTYVVRPPFVVRVFWKPDAVVPRAIQVCASRNARIFEQMKASRPLSEVPCYLPGTGMATSRPGDDPRRLHLYLSKGEGHNYYVPERRVDGQGYSDIYVAGVLGERLETIGAGTVYAIVLIDDNRDGVIDEAEFEFLEVHLAPGKKLVVSN